MRSRAPSWVVDWRPADTKESGKLGSLRMGQAASEGPQLNFYRAPMQTVVTFRQ